MKRPLTKQERKLINQRACFLAKDLWKLYRAKLEAWAEHQAPAPLTAESLSAITPDIRDLLGGNHEKTL
jgi:hypothetical protein